MRGLGCLLLLGTMLATPVSAADPTAPPPPATGDHPIVVTGKTARAVDTFVRQAASIDGDRQLARWNKPICINMLNLDPAAAAVIQDRIEAIGHAAGVDIAAKPCAPNILIAATQDPDDAIKQIHKDYPLLFRYRDNGDKPDADYQTLLKPAPIRWIDATETKNEDGTDILQSSGNPQLPNVPTNNVLTPSTINTSTREETILAVVVVDVTKLKDISSAQLADYLSMVVLGRPRFGAPFKGSTILAMFGDRDRAEAAPAGLTDMDLSLLKNLYATTNLRTAAQQRASIEYRLRHPNTDAAARHTRDSNAP